MRKRYGDFFTWGIPGSGNTLDFKGTIHVIVNPREMVKVIRSGGQYPSGLLEVLWVTSKWFEMRKMKSGAIFKSGPEWHRMRKFLQTDLLHPESARGYTPAMIQAAGLASKGAPAYVSDMKKYLTHCSFDLFSAVLFGEMTNTANPNAKNKSDDFQTNIRFAESTAAGLGESINILFDPFEQVIANPLGITTKRRQFCFDNFDITWKIALAKIKRFAERMERGELTANEVNSYLFRAIIIAKRKRAQI